MKKKNKNESAETSPLHPLFVRSAFYALSSTTLRPPSNRITSLRDLMNGLFDPLYALDDVDLAQLTSPARPLHRRARSDPTEIDWVQLRASRDVPLVQMGFEALEERPARAEASASASSPVRSLANAEEAAFKRALSPMAGGTGYSPAIKKHLSIMDMPLMTIEEGTRPAAPNSSISDDSGAPEAARALPDPESLGLQPLPLGEPCHLKKEPNYNKKDVPMWTVEEDLLILQLVEQVWPPPCAARAPRTRPALTRLHGTLTGQAVHSTTAQMTSTHVPFLVASLSLAARAARQAVV